MIADTQVAFQEEVVTFGPERRLVGMLTRPSAGAPPRATAVVLLNAGVVHRVGPQRLWVSLARRLADAGYTVLRFDHAGIGDSPAREDHAVFDESALLDVTDALDWLHGETPCRHFALLGLCSGTFTAFRAAQRDPRVGALVLLTALLEDPTLVPEDVVAEASGRRVSRSYVSQKATSGGAWIRLLTGRGDIRKVIRTLVGSAWRRRQQTPEHPGTVAARAALTQVLDRGVPVFFLFAEPSTVLEYFRMTLGRHLKALQAHGRVRVEVLTGADHTFTERRHQETVMALVSDWLATQCI